MPDSPHRNELIPGLQPPVRTGWTGTETLAAAATVLWLLVVALAWTLFGVFGTGDDPLRPILVLVAIFVPVALIWVAAMATCAVRTAEDETRRLQYALDSLRQSFLADRQSRALGPVPAMPQDPPPAPRETAPPQARPSPRPTAPAQPASAPPEEQPSLSLGGEVEPDGTALAPTDLILALHFPDDDRDEVGFAALRRALQDRRTRQLVQASQDVLTLLSQDGIYMDDLAADRSRPEIWRRFARGERGRSVAGLGGVHDRECIAIATARLREDAIFRDAAHHFLRLFDKRLAAFEPTATDEELILLAETRTARAFMLLGRVTGIFD